MPFLRQLIAAAAGMLLYQIAVVDVGGILSALVVPASYFEWFGRANLELGLAVIGLLSFAFPVLALVAGGVLAVHRLLAGSPRQVLFAVFLGLAAGFAYGVVSGALAASQLSGEANAVRGALHQLLFPPWWALPGALAPWAGCALAAGLLSLRPRRQA